MVDAQTVVVLLAGTVACTTEVAASRVAGDELQGEGEDQSLGDQTEGEGSGGMVEEEVAGQAVAVDRAVALMRVAGVVLTSASVAEAVARSSVDPLASASGEEVVP